MRPRLLMTVFLLPPLLGITGCTAHIPIPPDVRFAPDQPQEYSFTGVYDTTYGRIQLVQSGRTVNGTGTHSFNGIVRGNRMDGSWHRYGEAGAVYFVMSDDGKYVKGAWGYNNTSESKKWLGKRLGDPEISVDMLTQQSQASVSEPLIAAVPPNSSLALADGWAIVVGIAKYECTDQLGLSNLIYADDDARYFARMLKQQGWSDTRVRLFVNEEATQRNIMIALESWLTKAGPEDLIVLYWSGHGFPDPEDPEKVYFACYDTDINIPATGYRMDRVRATLAERRARNVVVLADTCHAGKLVTRGNERGVSIGPFVQKIRREKDVPKGWIFMVGADTDRKAIEHTSWSHGAFTKCLLDALSGQADGYESIGPKDGTVTMGELRAYMNTVMPDITQKVLGVAKHPIITTSTGDPDIWNLSLQAK